MFRNKKSIALIIFIVVIFSNTVALCFASSHSDYLQAFSSYTGKSIDELKQIEEQYGSLEEYFGVKYVGDQEAEDSQDDVSVMNSNGGGKGKAMSGKDWKKMKGNSLKGDILVSKDQKTAFINHGHAAIVWTSSEYTVEHTGTGKSNDYNIKEWKDRKTMRSYYSKEIALTTRQAAADYAYNNLRDKDYDLFANRYDKKEVNCATLVWQAYESQKVELKYTEKTKSVTPWNLVEEKKLKLRAEANWPGDEHTW